MAEFLEAAGEMTFGVWFLIGAALVFFMQCGFAMVEAGFTRAKNAGNIIMKNLMDFCIGSVVFVTLGSGLMLAEDYVAGVIGIPNLDIFSNWDTYNWSGFVFNLVFCATAATIVSGAMAERTKFSAYCIYSAVISAVVYPIEAGWVWNAQGWLYKLGFVDYAGSAAIHMVGGVTALIGAIILGPRIGKYYKDKNGKKQARAIPGHSITIGALGVFILWFGWYGFNGAAATDVATLGKIFVTTTLAPAFASCATMAYTWIKNGKPDVSMTLNGSLAGLVAITAGCANVNALGSIIIGLVAGVLVVVVVEFLDLKCHVDDPVGAVGVHCANGIWGTLAVGLFDVENGVFYGGGFKLFGIQALGVVTILTFVSILMISVFLLIKKVNGLRVSPEEEIGGLDAYEHGLESAYAGFSFNLDPTLADYEGKQPAGAVPEPQAVRVTDVSSPETPAEGKLTKIDIICKETRFEALKVAMNDIGVTGMTVTKVLGCGIQKGRAAYYRGVKIDTMDLNPKVQVEIVVAKVPVRAVIETAKKALYTGNIGDGKIFVYDVENAIKVRTGEEGYNALQGEDQF